MNYKSCLFFALLISTPAQALLIDRGDGMIYDSDLDVTWLQDLRYSLTSGYDSDGLMSWDQAQTWVSGLSVGGVSDWRLPTYNPANPRPTVPTTENELGSLWNTLSGGDILELSEIAPFFNHPNTGYDWYWTGLEAIDVAWRMELHCACWDAQPKSHEYNVLAVRSGDVSTVPEPASMVLMLAGLAGIGMAKRYS
ncbi:MAG: PEP-CTERM sorting domain-containing protein [Gammaproteobacteria bacterium]|nr:PEP-CTERM sorting domain-containing protein [Gammaproteobacteria bacterium]MDH5800106.1 PEP-CTERM sorting domain-containing protein [Gammaproteobacteria bacterium]